MESIVQTFLQDLRFGARILLKNPGFTFIAIITLALGIGANTAIFSVINSVLLRPLPYDEPDRLVMLYESNPHRKIDRQLVMPPNLVEWRAQSSSFENIAYWTGNGDFNLVTADGSEKARCAYVSSSLFGTLRAMPHLGRAAGNPANLAAAIYSEVKAINKNLPTPKAQTMNERLSDVVAEPRFQTLLLGLFGLVTLVMVSAGIYGVVSYSVAQRAHEIGVRMALGAQRKDVLKLVIRQGMKLAALGVAIGMFGAVALTRLLKAMLFGVSATDPLAFGMAGALLTGVVVLACYVPARRAAGVDPMIALRHD